ncbi:MAG: GxxExxY protein [Ignavibacteriaceae bacterium]|nr:GxxExxY protein [Ignavibacteriaceae bacterium]
MVVELKAAETLVPEHEAQLVNYLRVTDLEVGLLLNFGKEPQFKRKVLTKEFKNK